MVDVDRSGASTTVGSVATSLAGFVSRLALLTVAVLVTPGAAAAPTWTVSVRSGSVAPAASGGGCVQVTSCAAAAQVQSVPLPETNVSPAGRVSVTVMTLSSRCTPGALATRIVYAPLAPATKLPACDFWIDRSTTGSLVALTTCAVSNTRSPPAENTVVAEVWPGDSRPETSNVSTSTPQLLLAPTGLTVPS